MMIADNDDGCWWRRRWNSWRRRSVSRMRWVLRRRPPIACCWRPSRLDVAPCGSSSTTATGPSSCRCRADPARLRSPAADDPLSAGSWPSIRPSQRPSPSTFNRHSTLSPMRPVISTISTSSSTKVTRLEFPWTTSKPTSAQCFQNNYTIIQEFDARLANRPFFSFWLSDTLSARVPESQNLKMVG